MVEETSIRLNGDFGCAFGSALKGSLESALALDSTLPEDILQLVGMSGRLYRRLVNNLVGRIPRPAYLEVGSWAGSTASSVMYGNALSLTCIDNWSEFSGHLGITSPYEAFKRATSLASSERTHLRVIESDFRAVDYSDIGMYNVYLFDGPHEYRDQYDGLCVAQPALEDRYIQIVDDWNWPQVRAGTFDALREIGDIICSIEIRTSQDDSHTSRAVNEKSEWHNGNFFALVQKR